jgi:hypothetical protein
MNPPLPAEEEDNPSPHILPGPKKDYSLKDDQTFIISIPGRGGKSESGMALLGSKGPLSDHDIGSDAGTSGAFPLLPPPPSAPKKH